MPFVCVNIWELSGRNKMIQVDHIFIFCNDRGRSAEQLINKGFIEGSSRVHAGQGTTNRKFYFENCFIEIIWVSDEKEITSDKIRPMGLWERANAHNDNGYSPFGICVVNNKASDDIFTDVEVYQPDYFPEGMCIEILSHVNTPSLPMLFRLPIRDQKKTVDEPVNPARLKKVIVEHIDDTHYLYNDSQIEFKHSNRNWLTLIFENLSENQQGDFEKLQLTITGTQ